jgi:hypothetical protein
MWGSLAADRNKILALTGFRAARKHPPTYAQMAELVDALVSGTSAARRGGSSPLLGTMLLIIVRI